ncbi:MAG: 3-dehydroquinate synthase, partial [Anaerolineae bacterium]
LCAAGLENAHTSVLEILHRAVAVKVGIVERDPYETGERSVLNFGHTIGHAVEAASGFSVRHGEAVAIGMAAESRLAERMEIARGGLSDEICATLSNVGLPVHLPRELPLPALFRAMQNDKKRANGKVRFALPEDIGRMRFPVEVAELQSVFEEDLV